MFGGKTAGKRFYVQKKKDQQNKFTSFPKAMHLGDWFT